jgi:hypothetical protein
VFVDMERPQAVGTVVAVAAIGQRTHIGSAVEADEPLVLVASADGLPPESNQRLTRKAGFRSLSPRRRGVRASRGEGPIRRRSAQGQRLLPVPASPGLLASLDPNLDRLCAFVPATVDRSAAPTGRCHPSVTGTGVVPWSDHQRSSLDQRHHLLHEDFHEERRHHRPTGSPSAPDFDPAARIGWALMGSTISVAVGVSVWVGARARSDPTIPADAHGRAVLKTIRRPGSDTHPTPTVGAE